MMRWAHGIFGFLLVTAYCPSIVGGTSTPRWVLLAAVVPVALIGAEVAGRSIEITWAHIIGCLFLGWAALTLFWTANHYDSVDALWRLALVAGCFALGSLTDDARPLLAGMALGLGVSSVLVVVEAVTGWALPAHTVMAGLFGNRNYLGEAAALVLLGVAVTDSIGLRIWPLGAWLTLLAIPLPALVFTQARGGMAGLVVAISAGLWRSHPRFVAGLGVGAVVAIGLSVWWSPASTVDRFNIWRDAVDGLSLLGTGIGTFGATIAAHAHHIDPSVIRDTHAHNEPIEIAYELGVPGILLALAFVVSILRSDRPERLVFLAFIVEGFFAFPSALPTTAALGALAAGCAARGLPRVRLATLLGGDMHRSWTVY